MLVLHRTSTFRNAQPSSKPHPTITMANLNPWPRMYEQLVAQMSPQGPEIIHNKISGHVLLPCIAQNLHKQRGHPEVNFRENAGR